MLSWCRLQCGGSNALWGKAAAQTPAGFWEDATDAVQSTATALCLPLWVMSYGCLLVTATSCQGRKTIPTTSKTLPVQRSISPHLMNVP
jgi:hypothetical protein